MPFVVPGVGAEAGAASKPTTSASPSVRASSGLFSGRTAWASSRRARRRGTGARKARPQGRIAVLCQSGSIADAFLALGGRIGLRCVVSSGAEAVTDAADFLAFFADDPGTKAVGLFLETVRRPDVFVDALRRCAEAGKPVICLKVGRSEAAARAALSHTGALVGSDRAFSAVLRRYAAIEVGDFHELLETLEILGRERWPSGLHRGHLGVGWRARYSPIEPRRRGFRSSRCPSLAASSRAAFPNYLAPGNPLDAWGIADETEVYHVPSSSLPSRRISTFSSRSPTCPSSGTRRTTSGAS